MSMYVKKLGHCCLLIEIKGLRILTDPGVFSVEAHQDLRDLDIILITHEHSDHLHVDSLEDLVAHNPEVRIITNSSVGLILADLNIAFETIEDQQSTEVQGVVIEGFGSEHAEIFGDFDAVENTGYMIDDRLFYPGDAFTDPGKPVDTLAVPAAAPWMALKEAISYVNRLQPMRCFPVHDHVLSPEGKEIHQRVFAKNISKDIIFVPLQNGGELRLP